MNMKQADKSTEKIVYFVRHGQSVDNAAPVYQSKVTPLSELGKKQAEFMAHRISNVSFDALISSPLTRAKQTAEIIAKASNNEMECSDLFVERIKPSVLNGKPHADKELKLIWQEWEESLYGSNKRVEDGENYQDIILRADNALEYLQNRKEKKLVVVTHGNFLRTIVARVLLGNYLTPDIFKRFHKTAAVENTGITVLIYRENNEKKLGWYLWIFNDHAHLAD